MMTSLPPVRVRFAPSPTGHTHLGSGRTALYNYLLARQTGGQFILRIEDTDQKRFVPGAEQELMDSLRWLGLDWDAGPDVGGPHAPYRQSERREIYQQFARQLINSGHAYYCFCSPQRLAEVREGQQKLKQTALYDGTCRRLDPDEAAARVARGEKHVIRFKTPREGSIIVNDLLRGDITLDNRMMDDYVLVKSDGLALYHLAAMVDDHLMGITHVVRGSEWLSTYPLHIHIHRAFGWQSPIFAHLSIFLKPSGKGKMSKREKADLIQEGHSIFIKDLADLGYIPEGVVNWITLMGWSYDDHTEFFTLADLVQKFNLEHLNPSPAAIDFTKLDYFNGVHIRSLAHEDLAARVRPFLEGAGLVVDPAKLLQIIPLVRERLVTLDDILTVGGFYFREDVSPAPQDLVGKKMTPAQSADIARKILAILSGLPVINHDTAEAPLRALTETEGLSAGQVFGILRVAVTGQVASPPLLESIEVMGRQVALERLTRAIRLLESI